MANQPDIAPGQPPQACFKPAEQLLQQGSFVRGLEYPTTQHGAQNQSHQHRKHHGTGNTQRKLSIDGPRGARKEGHRNKNSRQHHTDANQRAGNLPHGLTRRLHRAQAVLMHHPLDVLHHHDGVIHQKADRQYETEESEHVDGKAEGRHDRKRAQQHHRDCDRWYQGSPPTLEKYEHDQDHQGDCLDDGCDHRVDGGLHERGRLVGVPNLHPFGKIGLELLEPRFNSLCDRKRVGTRRQIDAKAGSRFAIVESVNLDCTAAQLNAGNIPQAHPGPVGHTLEQDVAELFG